MSLGSPLGLVWLCTNDNGAECIYDEIDPKKLNDVERKVSENKITQEDNEAQVEVNFQIKFA